MNGLKLHLEKTLELLFKISYLVLALCTFNTFIYKSEVQPVFVKLTLAVGMVLILTRLIKFRKYIKMPCILLMILFCISFGISTIMNHEYGIVENGKWIIWTGLQFFALYVCDVEREMKSYNKEFEILSHILVGYSAIAAFISLGMLIVSYSKFFETAEGEFLISGFTWGRLWGVYTDPNYGAVFAVISILLSIVFILKKGILLKIVYLICIILNYLYLVFSDSRTGEISLAGGLVVFLFFTLNKVWKDKKGLVKYAMIIGVILFVTGSSLLGIRIVKVEYNKVLAPNFAKMFVEKEEAKKLKKQEQTKKPAQTDKTEEIKKQEEVKKQEEMKRKLGRKQDLEKDVSNGRFELWMSAVEVWKTSPVYGVGYVTFVPYAKEHTPNTYAVNNDVGEYTNMHNAFINTLAYQGVLGFIILLMLTGYMVWYVIGPIFRETDGINLYLSVMLSCVAAVVLSMMFLLEGFYTLSPGSFVLWGFSGYMVKYAYNIKKG
ncbi:MAG: hypothetical protein HFH13_14150 [Dorea sp.]|nr:hypothetical protein [Dorea sp.]